MPQEVGKKSESQRWKDDFEKGSYMNRGISKSFQVMHSSEVSAVFLKKHS